MLGLMVSILADVPAPLWALAGSLLGAASTLASTFLRNRYDSSTKQREQIYLDAIEAISSRTANMFRLADPNLADAEISCIEVANAAKLAKVELIAGSDTLQAFCAFSEEYDQVYLNATARRWRITALHMRLDEAQKLSSPEAGAIKDELRTASHALGVFYIEKACELDDFAIPALLTARKELRIKTDEVAYRAARHKRAERVKNVTLGFLTDLGPGAQGDVDTKQSGHGTDS
jgi:hypothetical protein